VSEKLVEGMGVSQPQVSEFRNCAELLRKGRESGCDFGISRFENGALAARERVKVAFMVLSLRPV